MSFANPVIVAIAVALFAATVLSALISSARTFVARVRDPEWLAAIAFAPVLAGAVSMLLLLGQHPWGSCHCLVHGSEHPHVCLAHPLLAAPLLPFAWVVIGLVIGNAGRGLARLVRDFAASRALAKAARRGSLAQETGLSIRLVDGPGLGAFTVGMLAPLITCGAALWASLDSAEKRVVALHEESHRRRRDPLTLLALRVVALAAPFGSLDFVVDRWRQAAERVADEHAARVIGDRLEVAERLVRVAQKLAPLVDPDAVSTLDATGGLAQSALYQLEERVLALVSTEPLRRAVELRSDFVFVGFAFATVLVISTTLPVEPFHHAVETVVGLL